MTINTIQSRLGELIERARQTGDYLTARAGFALKDALDAWKRQNSDLLNTAFNKVQDARRSSLSSVLVAINEANNGVHSNVENAKLITDAGQQIVNSLPFNKNVVITRAEPRLVRPDLSAKVVFRIFGTNLDKGQPEIIVGPGKPNIKPVAVTPTEAVFQIDRNMLSFSPSYIVNMIVPISYRPYGGGLKSFGSRNAGQGRIVQRLNIGTLPLQVAYVTWSTKVAAEDRVQRGALCDLGDFRGRNENVRKAVAANCNEPGDPDWRVDYNAAIAVLQGDGEAARCEGWENPSPNGFTLIARTDEIWTWNRKSPGHVNCSVNFQQFKTNKVERDGPIGQTVLKWNKDEIISTPSNMNSILLRVKFFDGVERIINTLPYSDDYLTIQDGSGNFVLRSKAPSSWSSVAQ